MQNIILRLVAQGMMLIYYIYTILEITFLFNTAKDWPYCECFHPLWSADIVGLMFVFLLALADRGRSVEDGVVCILVGSIGLRPCLEYFFPDANISPTMSTDQSGWKCSQ